MSISNNTIKAKLAPEAAKILQTDTDHVLSDREMTVFWQDILGEQVDQHVEWLKAYTWATNLTAQKSIANPIIEGSIRLGTWRGAKIYHRPGTAPGVDAAERQGPKWNIYLVLRKGYAETIDWTEARLTSPARYLPMADTLEVLFPNLNPAKLQELASGITSPTQNISINGENYEGSWQKIRVEAGQAEDGSGQILVRYSKGGRSLENVTVNTNCLIQTVYSYFYDYTQAEVEALKITVAAIPATVGWTIDFDSRRAGGGEALYDCVLTIRKETVDAAANRGEVSLSGETNYWGTKQTATPALSGDNELTFVQVQKDPNCTLGYAIGTRAIPTYLQTYTSADGRTTIKAENQAAAPSLPSGAVLLALSLRGKSNGNYDYEISYETLTAQSGTVAAKGFDYDETIVSGINQTAAPAPTIDEQTSTLDVDLFQVEPTGRFNYRYRIRVYHVRNYEDGNVFVYRFDEKRYIKFAETTSGYSIRYEKRAVRYTTTRTHTAVHDAVADADPDEERRVVEIAPHIWGIDVTAITKGNWGIDISQGTAGYERVSF